MKDANSFYKGSNAYAVVGDIPVTAPTPFFFDDMADDAPDANDAPDAVVMPNANDQTSVQVIKPTAKPFRPNRAQRRKLEKVLRSNRKKKEKK